jgi:hypothetical protein
MRQIRSDYIFRLLWNCSCAKQIRPDHSNVGAIVASGVIS